MAHNDLAWLYARCGVKLAEAQTHAERAVALQPRNAAYLDTLAEVAYRRDDKAKALELMGRCATLDPHDPVHQSRRAAFEADKP
jgi:tetratricopeptide (TPR) repeat protein